MKGRAFQYSARNVSAGSTRTARSVGLIEAKKAPAATSCVQLCRLVEEHGFVEVRQRGSHIVM
jgi:hypothetical protein